MISLEQKTDEIKSIIINKDIKKLKQNKFKLISKDKYLDESNENIEKYNYYVKLSKRLKRYLNEKCEEIIEIRYDGYGKIVFLVSKFNLYDSEIEMPIDIRIITGDNGDTYMSCSYYSDTNHGILYINRFESKRPNHGYGSLLLKNLDYIIKTINERFEIINQNSNSKFLNIDTIKGKAIPSKSIINQKNLNTLYRKYGFDIDDKNNIIKYLNFKIIDMNNLN